MFARVLLSAAFSITVDYYVHFVFTSQSSSSFQSKRAKIRVENYAGKMLPDKTRRIVNTHNGISIQ